MAPLRRKEGKEEKKKKKVLKREGRGGKQSGRHLHGLFLSFLVPKGRGKEKKESRKEGKRTMFKDSISRNLLRGTPATSEKRKEKKRGGCLRKREVRAYAERRSLISLRPSRSKK